RVQEAIAKFMARGNSGTQVTAPSPDAGTGHGVQSRPVAPSMPAMSPQSRPAAAGPKAAGEGARR
ncbi:MAG: hypothetical protein ACE5HU_10455, partial [Acidobacteriota bacterium]